MKKMLMLALLAVVATGAGCQRSWFTRGASCNTCPTGGQEYQSGTAPIQGYPTDGTILPQPTSG